MQDKTMVASKAHTSYIWPSIHPFW